MDGKQVCPRCAWVAGYNRETVLSTETEPGPPRRCSRCNTGPVSLRVYDSYPPYPKPDDAGAGSAS